MMQTLRSANWNVQLLLRKITKNSVHIVYSVKSGSSRIRDPSPLYLKWKLADHARLNEEKIASDFNKKASRRAIEYMQFMPTREDYERVLQTELKYSKEDARRIVDLDYITHRELEEFSKTIKVLKKYNVKPDILVRNSHVVWLSSEELENCLEHLMHTLTLSPVAALPITEIMGDVARYCKEMHPHDLDVLKTNRIHFLSQMFSVTPYRISCWISDYPYLLRLVPDRIARIEEPLSVLSVDQIFSNPSFLRYSSDFVLCRIKVCRKMKEGYTKPWMLRAPIRHIYNAMSDFECRDRFRMECENGFRESLKWTQFLAVLLDDSDPVSLHQFLHAIYFTRRRLPKIGKLIEIADVFEEVGYPRKLMKVSPYIYLLAHDTLKKRLSRLKKIGVTSEDFQYFTATYSRGQKYFDGLVQKYVTEKRKSTSDKHC